MELKSSKYIIFLMSIIYFSTNSLVFANHLVTPNEYKHSEKSYIHAWCQKNKGIEEYSNKDRTRVDCLTKKRSCRI